MVKCPECGRNLVLTGKIGIKWDVKPGRGLKRAKTEVYICTN